MRLKNNFCFCLTGLLLAFLLVTGLSCGKKKWPSPPGNTDAFAWGSISAKVVDSCMLITVGVTGNRNNLERITLELQVIESADDCKGCPFAPTESHEIEIDRVSLANTPADSLLQLRYCPDRPFSEDIIYRYRLVGHNTIPSLDPVLSLGYFLNVSGSAGAEIIDQTMQPDTEEDNMGKEALDRFNR